MFKLKKSFLVIAGTVTFINFIMMNLCGWAIYIAIYFVMPLNIYTAEQFVQLTALMSLGSMVLINVFLIKAGLYSVIYNHIPEDWK